MSLGSLRCSSVLSLFLLLTTIMRAFCVPSDATSFQCTDLKHISKSYTSEAFIVRVNYTFKGGSYYWEKWSRKGDGSERGEAAVFCKLVVLGLIRKVTLREDRKGGKESASPIWVESIQAEAGTRAWLVKAKPGGVEGTRRQLWDEVWEETGMRTDSKGPWRTEWYSSYWRDRMPLKSFRQRLTWPKRRCPRVTLAEGLRPELRCTRWNQGDP